MTNTNATNFRKNFYEFLNQAVLYNDVINVTTKNGNAVILSEEDYNSIMETLYLYSVPNMVESIKAAQNEPIEDCIPAVQPSDDETEAIIQAEKDIKHGDVFDISAISWE